MLQLRWCVLCGFRICAGPVRLASLLPPVPIGTFHHETHRKSTRPLPAPHPEAHPMHGIDGRHRPGHQRSELATKTVLPFDGDAKHAARESTNAGCRPGARLSIDLVDTGHRFSSEVVVRTTERLGATDSMAIFCLSSRPVFSHARCWHPSTSWAC